MRVSRPLQFFGFESLWLSKFSTAFSVVALAFFCALPALAAEAPTVAPGEIETAIAERLMRVPEFRFIREEARKLGVKVYLFGGTAAGFAHYTKWDLQREKGDRRFQLERFDYDFTNIYRSTQDLDIVVDGKPEVAERLAKLLQTTYPHFQGNKEQWEVRLLRQDHNGKQALLDNPDFSNQHTDSNSTGMIDVTASDPRDTVRDLRDWKSPEPQFLRDVAEGKIHYCFSPKHETTSRFVDGKNPSIFSVIRFLTKAFQYELELRPEDIAHAKVVIDGFKPASAREIYYVDKWLEENGKKLIRHAVNIEYAVSILDKLGLRSKLVQVRNSAATKDTLGWWLTREPLRTFKVGDGSGQTARELGIDIVAHETSDLMALESMTRAHTGDPNVLISRNGIEGELAAFGDGFYTRIGRVGARGTGLTIRMQVDPNAREGTDFFRAGGEYIVFLNKKAIRVIPESLNITYVEFFKLVETADASDRGTIEKLRRKFMNQGKRISRSELAEIIQVVRNVPKGTAKSPIVKEWMASPFAAEHPAVFESLVRRRTGLVSIVEGIFEGLDGGKDLAGRQRLLARLIEAGGDDVAKVIANQTLAHNQFDASMYEGVQGQRLLEQVFHPKAIDALARDSKQNPGTQDARLWTLLGSDGRTFLENYFDHNPFAKHSSATTGYVVMAPPFDKNEKVFDLFVRKIYDPGDFSEKKNQSMFERAVRSEIGDYYSHFLTINKVIEKVLAQKHYDMLPSLVEVAAKVLREKSTDGESRPELIRPAFVRAIVDISLRDKYPPEEVAAKLESALAKFVDEFGGAKKFEIVERRLQREVSDPFVKLVFDSKTPQAWNLRNRLMKLFSVYKIKKVTPYIQETMLRHYREEVANDTFEEQKEFVRNAVFNPDFGLLLIEIIGEEGPEKWLDFLRHNANFIGGESSQKEVIFSGIWASIIKRPKWQNSAWVSTYIERELETIRSSRKDSVATSVYHARRLALHMEAIEPVANRAFWRAHPKLLSELTGLSAGLDVYVIKTLDRDPSLINSAPEILDALARDLGSTSLLESTALSMRNFGEATAQAARRQMASWILNLLRHPQSAASPKLLGSIMYREFDSVEPTLRAELFKMAHWRYHPILLKAIRRNVLDRPTEVTPESYWESTKLTKLTMKSRLDKASQPTLMERAVRTVEPVTRMLRRAPTCPALFGAR